MGIISISWIMETIQRFLQPMSGNIDIVAVSSPIIMYITIQHICHIIQSGLKNCCQTADCGAI